MTATQHDKAIRFRELPAGPGVFVIPNPQDAGSARLLGGLGDAALAVVLLVITVAPTDRLLGLANADDKPLREGGVYNVGFAVHDNNITTRGHHESFNRTLGIGAKADIQAVKLP